MLVKIRRYFHRQRLSRYMLFCILTPANRLTPTTMRLKLPVWTTCGLLIFLLACNRNLVGLDYTNAKDEVPALTNLIFRFDKPLVNDSLTSHWDSTRYISFEPAIPGKFRWEHPDELIFSPSIPLSPATSYRATLKSDILQYSKYDHFKNGENILFH